MAARIKPDQSPVPSPLTYADYLALPEMRARYEIIDGVMMMMCPAPTTKHQFVIGNLHVLLRNFVRRHKLGTVLLSPVDIIVQRVPKLRTRQPDILFVSHVRRSIIKDQIEGGPDLVIEILSPGNTRRQIERKLADYVRIGVRECWLVSMEAEIVEVLQLSAKEIKRLGLYGAGDHVRSAVLPELALPVKKIFAE
jgi:Uma2 family endonuclease